MTTIGREPGRLLLGFAAAGASGFSATACLTSLCAFLAGAAAAGRAARHLGSRRHLLALAMTSEAIATGTAAGMAFAASDVSAGWVRADSMSAQPDEPRC